MAWLFRLPRVIALPVALLLVALAGLALALLAASLPLILLGLWLRRSLDEWKARRLLLSLYRSRVVGVDLVPAMREPQGPEVLR